MNVINVCSAYIYEGVIVRLYSRGQVFFFSLLSAVIVILFAVGFGLVKPMVVKSKTGSDVAFMQEPEDKSDEFKLMQSEYMIFNTSDELVQYSESERENIAIYEKLNSAVVNITTETMAINWFL